MSSRFFRSVLAIAAIATSIGISSAQAADEGYCKEYASTAINQRKMADRHRRCDGYLRDDPNRWTSNWRDHFNWCRENRRDDVRDERAKRTRILDKCSRRD
ncbi:MAG: hypothetical protein ABI583_01735 [Betaproteobacteria bacterium]